ncbi:MAG: phosphate acyltransferase [Robiginitomaculum sp.]|nr:MAG: phosphate acyltransferase [Robiginitomaculum sp.]
MLDGLVLSIDAMGGDSAPDIVIQGIEYFLKHEGKNRHARFLIHGDEEALKPLLAKAPLTQKRSEIHHTESVISMDAKPSVAMRRGKGTSMWNAIESVKTGEAKVAVSAGNTGALMAMSKLLLRMKAGVSRPAIAARWPHQQGFGVVLDVGANLGCDANQLREFAVLGEAYYRTLYKKEKPSIGLLNVGTEDLKGNATIQAAHDSLSCSELGLNYIGFVEGNDISMGDVDVIVTDGFTGNIALKTAEGTARLIGKFIKEALQDNLWSRMASILNLPALGRMKKRMDPRMGNGGVFLGLNGIVIKSHGGTDAVGFASALSVALEMADSHFLEEIENTLSALHDEDDNVEIHLP